MASTKPSKTLLKKLKNANIRVTSPSSVSYQINPVRELKCPIAHYLPPAGQYYDQKVLESVFCGTDPNKACVLCWNIKIAGQVCKCRKKCILCGSNHYGANCLKVYASVKWWRDHGRRPRKKAQLRPSLGERAYLVVAGVYKDWEGLEDPVVVNLEHPVVKAFYKGKDASCALTELPGKLRPSPTVAAIDSHTEPGADEASSTTALGVTIGSAPALTSVQAFTGELESHRDLNISAVSTKEANNVEDESCTSSVSLKEHDGFLTDLLEDTWQPSTYHEGTLYATVTPLSMRLAMATAQHFSTFKQATASAGNDVRADLDSRLQIRSPQRDIPGGSRSLSECDIPLGHSNGADQGHRVGKGCGECHGELQKAREEIRARNRRIHELELALHESEEWTDAVTYRGGQKRSRL